MSIVSKYEKAIAPHVPWFKEQILKSTDGVIRVKFKDVVSEMGKEFESINHNSVYSRLKDILLENGIKMTMEHTNICKDGLNVTKDKLLKMELAKEEEIISVADATYARNSAVANRQGFTYAEYINKSHYKNRGSIPVEENKDCSLYFGQFIEEKYVRQIFDNPIPFEFPKDEMGRITDTHKPYDYLCKRGMKIKHVASCLRKRNNDNTEIAVGGIREYYQYLVRRNNVPDYWILSGWDNRESLKPMFVWIIKKDEKIENQVVEMKNIPFWNRTSFAVYFNKKGIDKMKKYEVTDKLDKLKDVCLVARKEEDKK